VRSFGVVRVLCPPGYDNPGSRRALDTYLAVADRVAGNHADEGGRRASFEYGVGDYRHARRVHALDAVAHDVGTQASLSPGSRLCLASSSEPLAKILRPRQWAAGDPHSESDAPVRGEASVLVDLNRDRALRFRAPGGPHRGGNNEGEYESSPHYNDPSCVITLRSFAQSMLGLQGAP
jgi:hypothetical protein